MIGSDTKALTHTMHSKHDSIHYNKKCRQYTAHTHTMERQVSTGCWETLSLPKFGVQGEAREAKGGGGMPKGGSTKPLLHLRSHTSKYFHPWVLHQFTIHDTLIDVVWAKKAHGA